MTDKQEFETIFRRHYDGMFRLARRMLGDDAESKDVVSDVFAHLLSSGLALHSDTLQSFLLTIVRNRCINLLVHKQKTQQVRQTIKVEMQTAECDPKLELLQTLHSYIDNHLSELAQQILRLRYQQGLKYREIAEELKISEVTVYNHLSQSLKQLRNHFNSSDYGIK